FAAVRLLPITLCLHYFVLHLASYHFVPVYLHDALPISDPASSGSTPKCCGRNSGVQRVPVRNSRGETSPARAGRRCSGRSTSARSEEHTSELQSRENLVCRLLLEKKKKTIECTAKLSHK